MRLAALSLLVAVSVHAQIFLAPVTPDRAVSAIAQGAAADTQSYPSVASNGDIALVAWADHREGSWAIFASRVDAAGNVLDPLGVRIADGIYLNGVLWNGESFVIIVGTSMTFVSPDLKSITTRKLDLAPGLTFVAATTGSDPRLLFLTGVGSPNAAIVTARGDVVVKKDLWTIPAGHYGGTLTAGATETSFLVIHGVSNPNDVTDKKFMSELVDRDGNVLSSQDSHLQLDSIVANAPVAGSADGFLMVQLPVSFLLSPTGVLIRSINLSTNDASLGMARLVREPSRYIVAWTETSFPSATQVDTVAQIALDNSVIARASTVWPGLVFGGGLVSAGGKRFMVANVKQSYSAIDDDIFVRTLSDALHPDTPHLVALTATMQKQANVASTANGYAVTWAEDGPDGLGHAYVRRFSDSGAPVDAAPIPLFIAPRTGDYPASMRVKIVSNGQVLLLAWRLSGNSFIRRLDAATGAWIDPDPVGLGMLGALDLATNGTDALVLAVGAQTISPITNVVTTRRIPFTGPPLASPVIGLRSPQDGLFALEGVLASNGHDYLAAWMETWGCPFECPGPPSAILASRLRADGTAIDVPPLELFPKDVAVIGRNMSAGWSDGRYLIAWQDTDGVRGLRVADDGALVDGKMPGGGVLLTHPIQKSSHYLSIAPTVLGLGKHFVLLYRTEDYDGVTTTDSSIEAVVFPASSSLASVASLPRTIIVARERGQGKTAGAAVVQGDSIALAYDRLGGAETGSVPRVFHRLFREVIARHRSAGR